MRPSNIASRSLRALFAALLLGFTACGKDDPPSRPALPIEPGVPVEMREDADQVGMMDPIDLHAASRVGTNLNVTVMYGGCRNHTIRALASTHPRESYPLTIYVYLQHDDNGELCSMAIQEDLSYDMRPIYEWMKSQGLGSGPFFARVITPAVKTDPSQSKTVLFGL